MLEPLDGMVGVGAMPSVNPTRGAGVSLAVVREWLLAWDRVQHSQCEP